MHSVEAGQHHSIGRVQLHVFQANGAHRIKGAANASVHGLALLLGFGGG